MVNKSTTAVRIGENIQQIRQRLNITQAEAAKRAGLSTNYYARIYAPMGPSDQSLRKAVPLAKADLHWVNTSTLGGLPLTGLARKVLQRLDVMAVQPVRWPHPEKEMV